MRPQWQKQEREESNWINRKSWDRTEIAKRKIDINMESVKACHRYCKLGKPGPLHKPEKHAKSIHRFILPIDTRWSAFQLQHGCKGDWATWSKSGGSKQPNIMGDQDGKTYQKWGQKLRWWNLIHVIKY